MNKGFIRVLRIMSDHADGIDAGTVNDADYLTFQAVDNQITRMYNGGKITLQERDAARAVYSTVKKAYRAYLQLDR